MPPVDTTIEFLDLPLHIQAVYVRNPDDLPKIRWVKRREPETPGADPVYRVYFVQAIDEWRCTNGVWEYQVVYR